VCSSDLTISRYGYPPAFEDDLRALAEIGKLGFHFLEMEGLGPKHLRTVYQNRKLLRQTLIDAGLHVHNFCIIDKDLVSSASSRLQRARDRFKLGAELGDYLGAETLHLASYAPPVRFLGSRPYQLAKNNGYCFVNYLQIRIPPLFDWDAVWERLVLSCRYCAEVAAQHGKIVLMEPRVGEVICSVDSLLRLIDHVGCANFKANFDTAHFSAQRENAALALMKLRGKFANVHIADNNPINADHLPIGKGIIDWREFFRVLKNLKYEGYLGLDLGRSPTLVEDYRRSIRHIKAIADPLKIPIEF
jgi:sugar phosphate isomerase/epimerase